MKTFLFISVLLVSFLSKAQTGDSLLIPYSSILKNLKNGDSVTYYQCHVEEAIQQLSTASGQTLTGKQQKYSITEKFVVIKQPTGYSANYYTSSLNALPNRKFSGLKIREMPYWEFKKERSLALTDKDIKVFLALERKGKEAIEYDFVINKYNTNQLIIKQKKNFKQLVIEGDYVLSKLILKK